MLRTNAACASPLGRTRQTASLIADCLGLQDDVFEIDPLLAEHDVGELEGLGWAEIEADTRQTLEPHTHGLMFELMDGCCTPHRVDDPASDPEVALG